MNRPENPLTIQQLSRMFKIPKPTLRFWEKEFEGILVPLRTRGGQRRYTIEHISIIEEINDLKKRGLSLGEIRRELSGHPDSNKFDLLASKVAELVKAEVYTFLQNEKERE